MHTGHHADVKNNIRQVKERTEQTKYTELNWLCTLGELNCNEINRTASSFAFYSPCKATEIN